MIPLNIDSKTLYLLEDLRKDFTISFEVKNINYCEVFIKNKTAIVYYNPKIIDTEAITHELLHIWFNRFNCNLGNCIFLSTRSNVKLSGILTKFLCDHIANCCEHYKMYPKYIEMGYQPSKFMMNSLAPKASLQDLKEINLSFLWRYNSSAINMFIGCLISILADHVHNDYTKHHLILERKNRRLYKIITDFWQRWLDFDVNNIESTFNWRSELTDDLINELGIWSKSKRIIN